MSNIGLSDVIKLINHAIVTAGEKPIASDSGGQLKLASTNILTLSPPNKLDEKMLQTSQVMISGSSCLLTNLGLTEGVYNAHYDWNGQFFGLVVTGNVLSSVFARWAIEFPSTSGSVGIVLSGNLISGECQLGDPTTRKCIDVPEAVAAIVSRSQINIDISGNSCVGVFEKKDFSDFGGLIAMSVLGLVTMHI